MLAATTAWRRVLLRSTRKKARNSLQLENPLTPEITLPVLRLSEWTAFTALLYNGFLFDIKLVNCWNFLLNFNEVIMNFEVLTYRGSIFAQTETITKPVSTLSDYTTNLCSWLDTLLPNRLGENEGEKSSFRLIHSPFLLNFPQNQQQQQQQQQQQGDLDSQLMPRYLALWQLTVGLSYEYRSETPCTQE